MAEWSNAHAWKACIPQGIGGSNPPLSASLFFIFKKILVLFFLYAKIDKKEPQGDNVTRTT